MAAEQEARELTEGVPFRALILRTAPTDQPQPGEETIRFISQGIAATNDPAALAAMLRGSKGCAVTSEQITTLRVPMLAVVGGADPALAGVNELKAGGSIAEGRRCSECHAQLVGRAGYAKTP